MHDTADLEIRGVPSVYVATTEFVDGGEAQARAIGADVCAVFTQHPIQDRTDGEMLEIADKAFDAILEGLIGAR